MTTLNEVKTNLVNEFYQQDFMSTQEAAAWINSFLDKNCKEVFEKANMYDMLGEKIKAINTVKSNSIQRVIDIGDVAAQEFQLKIN